MRSAGCVINDIFDRDIDAQVKRTKSRPLASGELTINQAIMLLCALLAAALPIAFALGWKALVWSAFALPLIVAYPLMKRIIWWPQLFLGLTFNWGVLVAAIVARGEITIETLLLYSASCFWTLGYDTIYAMQDKQCDIALGVKSSAVRVGNNIRGFVALCYIAFLALFAAAFHQQLWSSAWLAIWSLSGFSLMFAHLFWQINKIKTANISAQNLSAQNMSSQNISSCRTAFLSNSWFGLLAFIIVSI